MRKILNVNDKGNKKLVNNENVVFFIWNLPSIKTCPFSTPQCRKNCYAKKAENIYPNVLPSRENNYNDSLDNDFVVNMVETIVKLANKRKNKGKKIFFRIHESGDFYSVEYMKKWVEIASYITQFNDIDITFLAYTKSIKFYDLIRGAELVDIPNNFIVRSSIWSDTLEVNKALTDKWNLPIYTASNCPQIYVSDYGYSYCPCNNCGTCQKCYKSDVKNIICKIH